MKKYKHRKIRTRDKRKRILIVCEGEKTEPNYFRAFKISSVRVQIEGTGKNTKSLVEHALTLKKEAVKADKPFHEVWCVFDRDSFPLQDWNDAFDLATQEGLKVAASNEAFELWYLLHFHLYGSAHSRSEYEDKLTKQLKELTGITDFKYRKNDPLMYDHLLCQQITALKNAEKLYADNFPDNPSTSVHLLVSQLNTYTN